MKLCEPDVPEERVIDCSNPSQVAPFQPSPHESNMVRVHVLPPATVALPVKGAPPLRLVPSSQESVQLTSLG